MNRSLKPGPGNSALMRTTDKKKKKFSLKDNAGVTKQELASGSRKIARSMHPKAKKQKGETSAQKAQRKQYNKDRKKEIKKAGQGHKSDEWGKARKFLHGF